MHFKQLLCCFRQKEDDHDDIKEKKVFISKVVGNNNADMSEG